MQELFVQTVRRGRPRDFLLERLAERSHPRRGRSALDKLGLD